MDIVIRKATLEDLKVVQDLNYKLFDFEHKNFVWVAIDNDKIIGYLAGIMKSYNSINAKSAEVDNFYIEEEYRRLGIGKRLVNEYKEYCKSKGIDTIYVTANAKNKNARSFYQASGFNDEYEVTYKMKID